ncbi:MAG: hypothetical protein K0U98_08365 [Deltaproteobacteria bacterium]|nr:hypothetical protein [Deltaproteobacteria bacterium]
MSSNAPKWFRPVAIVALLWNLMGCAAYLADARLTPDDIAQMGEAQQAMYAARPAWAVGATAIAVWAGAIGCLGLIFRKRWAFMALVASLAGVVFQDIALFGIMKAASAGAGVLIMQGIVLVVAILLVLLARKGIDRGWLT